MKLMETYTSDVSETSVTYVKDVKSLSLFELWVNDCQLVGIDSESNPNTGEPTLLQLAMRRSTGEEIVFLIDLLFLSKDTNAMSRLNTGLASLFTNKSCVKIGQSLLGDLEKLYKHFREKLPCLSQRIEPIVDTQQLFLFLYPFERKSSLQWIVARILRKHLLKDQQRCSWSRRPLRPEQLEYAICDALVLLSLYEKMCNDFHKLFPDKSIISDFSTTIQKDCKLQINESFTRIEPIAFRGKSLSTVREELGIPNELLLDIAKELSPISANQTYTTIASIQERYFPSNDITDIRRLFCDDMRFMVIDDYLFRFPRTSLGRNNKLNVFCQEVLHHLLIVRKRKLGMEDVVQYFDSVYPDLQLSATLQNVSRDLPILSQRNSDYGYALAFAIDINHFLAKDASLIEEELQEILNCDLQYFAGIESMKSPSPSGEEEQLLDAVYQFLQSHQARGDPQQQQGVLTLSALQAHFNLTMDSMKLYHLLFRDRQHRFVLIKDQIFPTQIRKDVSASQTTNKVDAISYYLSLVYYLLKTSQLQLTSQQLQFYLNHRYPDKVAEFDLQLFSQLLKDRRFLTVKQGRIFEYLFECKDPPLLLAPEPDKKTNKTNGTACKSSFSRLWSEKISVSPFPPLANELQAILDYELQLLNDNPSVFHKEANQASKPSSTLQQSARRYLLNQKHAQNGVSLSALHAHLNLTMDNKELYHLLLNDKHRRFVLIKDQVFPTEGKKKNGLLRSQSPTEFSETSYYHSLVYYLLKITQIQVSEAQIISYLTQRFRHSAKYRRRKLFCALDRIAVDPRFILTKENNNPVYLLKVKSSTADTLSEMSWESQGLHSPQFVPGSSTDPISAILRKQIAVKKTPEKATPTQKPLLRLRPKLSRRTANLILEEDPDKYRKITLLLSNIANYLHEELSEEGKLEGVEVKELFSRFVKDPLIKEEMPIKRLAELCDYLDQDKDRRFIVLNTKVYPLLRDLNKRWVPISPRILTMKSFQSQRRYLELCRERYLEDQVVVEKIYHWIRLRGGEVTLDELYRVMANRRGYHSKSFSAFIKFTLRQDPRLEVNFAEHSKSKSTVRLTEFPNLSGNKGSLMPSERASSTVLPERLTAVASTSLRESLQKMIHASSGFIKKLIR